MNFLSIVILAGIMIWFILAVIYIVRKKGCGCGCGGDSGCCGNCAGCKEKCHKQ